MQFVAGNAYLLKCLFTRPSPKKKYSICVCEEKPLFFFINSDPRTRFNSASQLLVTPSDLPFLSKKSYVNTADVITCDLHYSCEIIKSYGDIPLNIKEKIKAIVIDSPTLPPRFINIIINKL